MVRLDPMSSEDFGPFLDDLTRTYATNHIAAGRWSEKDGLAESKKEIQQLLPAGKETPQHFFFTIVAGPPDAKVGAVWLAIEPRGAFVYDLVVFESFRRRGFAEEAMRLLEPIARDKGAQTLALHVFGGNTGARKLYTKLGYVETNVRMSKPLAP